MKTKMIVALALASTMLTSAAHADNKNWPNWYIALGTGANFTTDGDVSVGAASSEVEHDTGYLFSAALGYAPATDMTFIQNTRWEVEYLYRSTDLNSIGGTSVTGTVDSNSLFANLYYDFNNSSRWTPYVGAGFGITNVEADLGNGLDDNSAAWQLLAGLTYAPASMPQTAWSLGYRFHDLVDDAKFTTFGVPSEYEYSNHSVEVNGRFRF